MTWFHRWSGVVLCVLFAVWFATGAVMVFVPFPSLSQAEAEQRSDPIRLDRIKLTPAAVAPPGAGDVRLISILGDPAYVVQADGKKAKVVSAIDGRPRPALGAPDAVRIAERFAGRSAKRVSGPFDYDQWAVHQHFDPLRPLYRVRLDDAAGTDLYVSARTGEVVQKTARVERALNWVGSVVHWIYFVPIRKVFSRWDWTVWIIALVGVTTAAAGIWLGVSRTLKKMNSRRPDVSPFRGMLRLHHILGLTGGVFVLCWICSGWLSMDHGRLFSEGQPTAGQSRAYQGGSTSSPPIGLQDLGRLGSPTSIAFEHLDGASLAVARGPGGAKVLIRQPTSIIVAAHVPPTLILAAAQSAWPDMQFSWPVPVDPDTSLAKAESLPDDALMVRMSGAQPARLYVDGVGGKVLVAMDRSREAYAWFYYMLHTYNFPGLSSRPVLRITLLMIPLTLGFVFAVTGVLVGIRRLRGFVAARS